MIANPIRILGCKYPKSRRFFMETSEKIERLSKIVFMLVVKIIVQFVMIPKCVVSFAVYFISDAAIEIKRTLQIVIPSAQKSVLLECFGSITCNREIFKSVGIESWIKSIDEIFLHWNFSNILRLFGAHFLTSWYCVNLGIKKQGKKLYWLQVLMLWKIEKITLANSNSSGLWTFLSILMKIRKGINFIWFDVIAVY